jgi:hypothetical protein
LFFASSINFVFCDWIKQKLTGVKNVAVILLFFLATSIQAQKGPSFISIKSGLSIPYGSFYDGASTIEDAFALPGSVTAIEAAYFYSPNVGVGMLINFNTNPIDTKRMSESFDLTNKLYNAVEVEAEPYYTMAYMFGFYFNMPVKRTSISFTSNLMMGFLWARNPNYNFKYFYRFGELNVHQPAQNRSNFALYYCIGAKAQIMEKLGLSLSADYVGSQYYFNYDRAGGSGNIEKRFSYVGVYAGVYYVF